MKKQSLFFYLLLFSLISNSQNQVGLFDTVLDRHGNKYVIDDLNLNNPKHVGGGGSTNSLPSQSCQVGHFNLFFAPASIFSTTAAQTVICQLFSDISSFIISPLSSNSTKVNIFCDNTPSNQPNALGAATGFYVFPAGATNPNQGIIYNQIQKTILTGIDAFIGIPSSFVNGSSFYHGLVQANPNPVGGTWTYNLAATNINSGEYDFYTVMLHEVMHALGFTSLISSNGNSVFGSANNYFSKYDQFLKTSSGAPLISNSTSSSCPNSSITFVASTSVINSATTGCVTDVSNCTAAVQYSSSNVNVKVYTPNCFDLGHSLSHFEDMCPIPSTVNLGCATNTNSSLNNNLYYVTSNAQGTGTCYVKRSMKDEEKAVMCDLGYSVNSVYGSTAVAGSSYTYNSGSCNGTNVWGQNDGFVGGAFTFTAAYTTTNAIAIDISSSITANDSPGASMSCIEVLYNNATAVPSSGSLIVTASSSLTSLVIIKYLPQNGNNFGNPTYIFVYFSSQYCSSSTSCEMVKNGGFENYISSAPGCGAMTTPLYYSLGTYPSPIVDCWQVDYTGNYLNGACSPDYFRRNCNSGSGSLFNLGSNTMGSNPAVDSYNLSPNDGVVAIIGALNSYTSSERLIGNLNTPLSNGLSYQISMWLQSNTSAQVLLNLANSPLVLRVSSILSAAINGSPNIIAEFTVNPTSAWSVFTNTFVFTPTVAHSAIVIGIDGIKSASLTANTTTGNTFYCFLDDISIKPLPTPTFVIPNASTCGNTSFTNLAQYASPIAGFFSGSGVTTLSSSTGPIYNFSVSAAGSYPISFNYTTSSGCPEQIWQNIVVSPTIGISVSGNTLVCSNSSNQISTLTAVATCSCNNGSYSWLPNSYAGQTRTISVTGSAIYTVSVVSGSCTASQTVAVGISTSCCTNTIPSFSTNLLQGNISSFPNSIVINHDVMVQANQSATLKGTILLAPNVKITVSNGATLTLTDAHLFACSANMWEGIKLKSGSTLSTFWEHIDNLIEDAITGIDLTNYTLTGNSAVALDIRQTTFNKNYIDINISSYQPTLNTSPFKIESCVFTCRDLTSATTNSSWPQTGTITTTDLRYLTSVSGTTGLIPPYLGQSNFSLTLLKNPYSAQPSHIGIKLSNVGLTSGTVINFVSIGSNSLPADFNLFDTHGKFVEATNSNVKLINNVFQNTRNYLAFAPPNITSVTLYGGYAIDAQITNTMVAMLDLTSGNISTGNKFWNCQTGVNCKNIYRFNIENALFRSNQSTLTPQSGTFIPEGWKAINLNTNRFMYYIKGNEFTNIANPINIPITWGYLPSAMASSVITSIGAIFAANISILHNTISPISSGTIGSNYTNRAISITCPNNFPIFFATPTLISPLNVGVFIGNNKIKDSFRPIHFNGLSGVKTVIQDNDITLRDDIITPSSIQSGIELQNHLGTANQQSQASLTGNTLTGQNTTNTLVSLVDCENNIGLYNPSVTCNYISNAGNGFLFNSTNSLSVWQGNEMTNLGRGLILDNDGRIGQQGDGNFAGNNQWLGSWSGLSETYVNANSNANFSLLYVRSGSPFTPTNNLGFAAPPNLYSSSNLIPSNNGDYQCGGVPNNFVVPLPNQNDYADALDYYIVQTAFYRFLHHNDSVRNSGSNYGNFYTGLQSSNIGQFNDVEEKLFIGDFTQASSVNNNINPGNSIETNYKLYYNLYLNYFTPGNSWNVDDSTELYNLTQLCPGDDGACVLQARGLYNSVYNIVLNYPLCGDAGNKMSNNTSLNKIENIEAWTIELFPNPNYGNFAIISKPEKEKLEIKITDIKGAIVYNKQIETNKNVYVLDLSLINGMYLVTIKNESGHTLVKKMAVNK